jgi:hypothetical protein
MEGEDHGTHTEQIKKLHARHKLLIAEIRLAADRAETINQVLKTGKLPAGKKFDDIGTPLKEQPA